MFLVKTVAQKQILIDFHLDIYNKLLSQYESFNDFLERLKSFNTTLAKNKILYNINPYPNPIEQSIYILGIFDTELGIFPKPRLALKCSLGTVFTENLRKQFYRSIQLSQDFEVKFNTTEKHFLKICPVYLHVQIKSKNSVFKQILFMQWIVGETLGSSESGFSEEFCQAFNIPSLEEIRRKPQFALHLYLDRNKKRQLLKIQTAYLFKYLWRKGIKILSLNQKNILISKNPETGQNQYIIIDPVSNFSLPLSPLYNAFTSALCN
jgi:hypothetical protein